jgi:hypothetical protein
LFTELSVQNPLCQSGSFLVLTFFEGDVVLLGSMSRSFLPIRTAMKGTTVLNLFVQRNIILFFSFLFFCFFLILILVRARCLIKHDAFFCMLFSLFFERTFAVSARLFGLSWINISLVILWRLSLLYARLHRVC